MPSGKTTAHKAHYTALAMLVVNIALAWLGVIDVDPTLLLSDLKEALTLASALLIPTILGWLTPYLTRNRVK